MVSHDRRFNVTARPWAFLYHPLLGQSSSHEGPTGAFVVSRTARAPDHTGPPRRAAGGTEYLWSDWEFPFLLFSM